MSGASNQLGQTLHPMTGVTLDEIKALITAASNDRVRLAMMTMASGGLELALTGFQKFVIRGGLYLHSNVSPFRSFSYCGLASSSILTILGYCFLS